jgi:hypothetical protein
LATHHDARGQRVVMRVNYTQFKAVFAVFFEDYCVAHRLRCVQAMNPNVLFAAAFGSLAIACAPPSVSLKCPESALAAPSATPPASDRATVVHTTSTSEHRDRHFYRLDFVLTATDGAAPQTTSFSLTLGEHDHGDVHIGKNVMLTVVPPTPTTTSMSAPRQDVGVKVSATLNDVIGDDVMLDVQTEVSAFDPPTTIRKISANGKAVAAPGKPTVVAMLDEDKKRYQLSVTPTKIR